MPCSQLYIRLQYTFQSTEEKKPNEQQSYVALRTNQQATLL